MWKPGDAWLRSTRDDDNGTAGGRHQPAEVMGIAGEDPVPDGGDGHDCGIDRVPGACPAKEDSSLAAELEVDGSDVDGPQEATEVRLPASRVAPHLGDDHGSGAQLDPAGLGHSQPSHGGAVIAVRCDQRPSVENERTHAAG